MRDNIIEQNLAVAKAFLREPTPLILLICLL